MRITNLRMILATCIMALCSLQVSGEEFVLDFETDPQDLNVEFFGNAEWRDEGGFEDSGYLSVTDALNGQRGAIVFPDLSNGGSLTSFSIEADLRVGGGTDRPADGFSFNFVRPNDPVLDDGEGWAASPTGEQNLPEEGTTTGVAIGFDEWFSGGSDVVGMSVRLDNELVNQFEFPVLNGDADDQESLQTGPPAVDLEFVSEDMEWAHLSIKLCANNLEVTYKDVEVFNEPVDYDPSPGQLVFGGRTGGANAHHHIDNITVKTGDDVGVGCTVVPPSFVAGEGTIGSRSFDPTTLNEVFGPEAPGAAGWKVTLVDSETTINDHITAEIVLEDEDGEVSSDSYPVVDIGGGAGTFPETRAYPNGVADTSMEDFAVKAEADVTIPAGDWTIAFGSDDGGQITINGIEFLESNSADSFDDDQIRFEGNRGHGWTTGTISLDEPLETSILASMHERGGGDSFEIAITEGHELDEVTAEDWELLGNGTLGWEVTHTGTPLESADLSAAVTSERPLEFDVDGDSNTADQLIIENPDSGIYTTILDVDGVTFQIAGSGDFSDGDTFDIISADQIVGTPVIVSKDPSQTWTFNAQTGQLIFGAGGGNIFDLNNDGSVDVMDVDLLTAGTASGSMDAALDVSGDGSVDFEDIKLLVTDPNGLNSWIGDSNLDGEFGSGDLVDVFGAGKFETGQAASWSEGDWNGDGQFGTGDLVAAFQGGGFEQGQRAVASVPEPSSIVLALFGCLGIVNALRRRK